MSYYDRMRTASVAEHLRKNVLKADDGPPDPPVIDTAWGRSWHQELEHANRRLRLHKAEGGDVDLTLLATIGIRRSIAKADTVPVPPALKLLWFRMEYPQLALGDEFEVQAMADRLFATLSEKEQARFVAMSPDIASPNNSGDLTNPKQPPLSQTRENFSQAYETARGVLAEMLPGGAYKQDNDSVELDTSRQTVDGWVQRRVELRQKAEQTRTTTTVTKTDSREFDASLGRMAAEFRQKADGKITVFKRSLDEGLDLEHLFK